jgi:hypothetical protein
MPQKVIRFNGINRKINEFQSNGACEELINVRPISTGLEIVRPKKKTDIVCDEIYEHAYGDVYNQIAITNGSVEWVNPKEGGPITITNEFASKNVSISYAGNVLVIYCEDEKKQVIYKFEDESYKLYTVVYDQIRDAKITYASTRQQANNYAIADDDSEGSFNDAMYKSASGFHSKYPYGLCGASIVGCAYELEDGSEVWSTAFVVANTARSNWSSTPVIDKANKKISTPGASSVTLTLSFGDIKQDGVKKINIYSTKPVYPYEILFDANSAPNVNEIPLEDTGIGGMVMYYQDSITPAKGAVSLRLKFGTELTGGDIMKVNPGCIERIGKSISYNNRFHFYRSEVSHVLQVPSISNTYIENASVATYWIAYVNINDEWKLINHTYRWTTDAIQDFIYPMAGVKRLAFVKAQPIQSGQVITGITVPYTEMFFVDLKNSSSYNYSYAFDVAPSIVSVDSAWYNEIRANNQTWDYANTYGFDKTIFWKKEVNAINVSAPYNPYVFPVEYSYSFGGEIIDIATSYLPISYTQVGQYPLTVFTSVGIFAMEQGDGSVLYSNITPLQPLVLDGKSTSTPYGTFFVSSKNLYMLLGRETLNVSDILNGERELYLRDLDAYKKLCGNGSGFFYNFLPLLSNEDFEEFIPGATLAYDQLHNELYISSGNENIPYSYVFNLDTKAFHKAARKYAVTQNGARYAIEIVGKDKRVVDMHTEIKDDVPILLQSRPMPIEAFFTHIQRLILLADARLKNNQYFTISVFGSDNLNDWKCIISSQKMDTAFRQIRTNRAAKSYRDYVVLITGMVNPDTDISDLIADYTVVNRRLG